MIAQLVFRRLIPQMLIACLLMTGLQTQAAAGMIGTAALARGEQAQADRERIQAALEREQVRERLAALGVDPREAQARVAMLTDQEAIHLARHMDEMPAGGIDILGAALLVFIILLITDIAGWTDIFPFVKKNR